MCRKKILITFLSVFIFVFSFGLLTVTASANTISLQNTLYTADTYVSADYGENLFSYKDFLSFVQDNTFDNISFSVGEDGSLNFKGSGARPVNIELVNSSFPFSVVDTTCYKLGFIGSGTRFLDCSIYYKYSSDMLTEYPSGANGILVGSNNLIASGLRSGLLVILSLPSGDYDIAIKPMFFKVPLVGGTLPSYSLSKFFYYDMGKYTGTSFDMYEQGYNDGYEIGNQEGYAGGYEEGYNDGLSYGEMLGYNNGYYDGLEEGSKLLDNVEFGALATAKFHYRFYFPEGTYNPDFPSVEVFEEITLSFEDLTCEGRYLYLNSSIVEEEAYNICPDGWKYSEIIIEFEEPVVADSLFLGLDSSYPYSLFSVSCGGVVDLLPNVDTSKVFAPYVLSFAKLGDSPMVSSLVFSTRGLEYESACTWIFESTALVFGQGSFSVGFNEGYYQGHEDGYDKGKYDGYKNGYSDGEEEGHRLGYAEGLGSNTTGFVRAVSAVIGAPVSVVKEFLNFEILGVNMLGFFSGLITLLIVVKCIKRFI